MSKTVKPRCDRPSSVCAVKKTAPALEADTFVLRRLTPERLAERDGALAARDLICFIAATFTEVIY